MNLLEVYKQSLSRPSRTFEQTNIGHAKDALAGNLNQYQMPEIVSESPAGTSNYKPSGLSSYGSDPLGYSQEDSSSRSLSSNVGTSYTSTGRALTSTDLPSSGMTDLQKAQIYTGLGTKALGAASELSKAIGYPTIGGYLGKAAEAGSALLSAYSAYKIGSGEAHASDYMNVAGTASKYGLGADISPYTGGITGLYNITQGSKNPLDYTSAASGALSAGANAAALSAYGEGLAGASGAATSAASSTAGSISAGLGTAGSVVGAAGAGYAVPAILDSVGALPKDGVERGMAVGGSATAAGAITGAMTALGGPLGAVLGAAAGGVYGFISGNSGLTESEIRDQQAREYAKALQDYAASNPNYVYSSSSSPYPFSKYFSNIFGEFTKNTMTEDQKSGWIKGAIPNYYFKSNPDINFTDVNSDNFISKIDPSKYQLTDEQINKMLKEGTFRDYVGTYIQAQQGFMSDAMSNMFKDYV